MSSPLQPPVRPEPWQRRLLEVLREDEQSALSGIPDRQEPPKLMEVLSVRIGAERYGLRIGHVAEILLPRPLTPVPRTPSYLLGVLSLRGAVLPVLDLALYLGLTATARPAGSRLVILRDGEERVGFWVDGVEGVIRFAEEDVEFSGFAAAVDRKFLRGITYDREGHLVALLLEECLLGIEIEKS